MVIWAGGSSCASRPETRGCALWPALPSEGRAPGAEELWPGDSHRGGLAGQGRWCTGMGHTGS